MAIDFGPFRLDEAARTLTLSRREVPLQPLIFDLLVYLLNTGGRAVSKDELLDALWPGVTVTENSLQRAISTLRGVLREGGLERAVRNVPRMGYRLCLESKDGLPEAEGSPAQRGGVEVARRAKDEQRWADAARAYAAADAVSGLQGGDLENWAHALQCLGRPSEAVPLLVRAVADHTAVDASECGARAALALSAIHLERGEAAIAKGWHARAADLVEGRDDCLAAGELLWMGARIAANDGEPERAVELADAAYAFGRSRRNVRIEALGLMYRGFYRLSLGDIRAGLADQDHAAALALSGQVDPITGGVLYCNILWACRTFGDWTRAYEWTLGYESYYTRNHMDFSGSCMLHRAECLGVQGSLSDARDHILASIARLPNDAPWALGDAHRVLGDIEAAIGDGDAALAAYAECYRLGWSPEPGRALLLIERGQAQAAYASLERSLIGESWWTLQRRGMLLANLALAAAHAGLDERAKALVDELSASEARWPTPSVRALTAEASALVRRRGGQARDALEDLHRARLHWTSVGSRFNAARVRIEIGELQIELGDEAGAWEEIRTAEAEARLLGSHKLLARCQALAA